MLGIWTCMYQVFGYLLSRISFRWIVLNRGTFSGIFSFLKGGARKVIITKDFVRSWTNCCSVVIRKYGSCEVILSLLDKRNEVPIFLIYPVNLRSLGVQICEVLLTLFRLEYIVPQWRNLYLRYCETTSEKLFLKLLSKPGQSKINTWIDRNSFYPFPKSITDSNSATTGEKHRSTRVHGVPLDLKVSAGLRLSDWIVEGNGGIGCIAMNEIGGTLMRVMRSKRRRGQCVWGQKNIKA